MFFPLTRCPGRLKTAKWTFGMEMRACCANLVSELDSTRVQQKKNLFLDFLDQDSRAEFTKGDKLSPHGTSCSRRPGAGHAGCGGGHPTLPLRCRCLSCPCLLCPGELPRFLVQPLQKNRVPRNANDFLKSTLKKNYNQEIKEQKWNEWRWKIASRLAKSFADEKNAEASTLGWKMISIFTWSFPL